MPRRPGLPIIGVVLMGLGAVSGCGKSGWRSCEKYAGAYPIEYIGGALGRGRLQISTSPQRADHINAVMTLWDDTGTDAVVRLGGPGTCEAGVLRIRFGGGDHPRSKIKVLGGNLVSVPQPELFDWMFGAWEVKVLMKETNTERSLTGFLRLSRKATPEANGRQSGSSSSM
jgi:hypothetical protein